MARKHLRWRGGPGGGNPPGRLEDERARGQKGAKRHAEGVMSDSETLAAPGSGLPERPGEYLHGIMSTCNLSAVRRGHGFWQFWQSVYYFVANFANLRHFWGAKRATCRNGYKP